jgi:cyclopropane fatty-acyl-phospholipid synthase-like methyltransferase
MNNRLNIINDIVNKYITTDIIDDLLNKYKSELEDYNYINSIDIFSTLSLKGSLKYINKYDKQLRYGGLLIKIFKDNNNEWIGIIKKISGKKYYIKFSKNYIFYLENDNNIFKKSLKYFISNYEIN